MNKVLIFKSIDVKTQNSKNKPGNFTTNFSSQINLEPNKQYSIALNHLSMTASWHNIKSEFRNNKLVISKDGGKTTETLTFPPGVYDYEDIGNLHLIE